MLSKRVIMLSFPLILIIGVYFLGPEPETPKFDLTLPSIPSDPSALEKFVSDKESLHKIKPGNEDFPCLKQIGRAHV